MVLLLLHCVCDGHVGLCCAVCAYRFWLIGTTTVYTLYGVLLAYKVVRAWDANRSHHLGAKDAAAAIADTKQAEAAAARQGAGGGGGGDAGKKGVAVTLSPEAAAALRIPTGASAQGRVRFGCCACILDIIAGAPFMLVMLSLAFGLLVAMVRFIQPGGLPMTKVFMFSNDHEQ